MEKLTLLLYIVKNYPTSIAAEKEIREILKNIPDENYSFEVIDVINNPEKAEQEKIIAYPALVRKSPLPVRKIIGSFHEHDRICEMLNLDY